MFLAFLRAWDKETWKRCSHGESNSRSSDSALQCSPDKLVSLGNVVLIKPEICQEILQGNAVKWFEGLTMCSCSVTKIWESSEPVIVFRTSSTLLNSSLVFDFRGGVIKDSSPIQSLRDLIQEEEKKRNILDQTPSPKVSIISGKSGSTKKKLKYSTSLLKSPASPWSRIICNENWLPE